MKSHVFFYYDFNIGRHHMEFCLDCFEHFYSFQYHLPTNLPFLYYLGSQHSVIVYHHYYLRYLHHILPILITCIYREEPQCQQQKLMLIFQSHLSHLALFLYFSLFLAIHSISYFCLSGQRFV